MAQVLEEAWEMVEHELITEADFRDFVFTNPIRLYTSGNPNFFDGTTVEPAITTELASTKRSTRGPLTPVRGSSRRRAWFRVRRGSRRNGRSGCCSRAPVDRASRGSRPRSWQKYCASMLRPLKSSASSLVHSHATTVADDLGRRAGVLDAELRHVLGDALGRDQAGLHVEAPNALRRRARPRGTPRSGGTRPSRSRSPCPSRRRRPAWWDRRTPTPR